CPRPLERTEPLSGPTPQSPALHRRRERVPEPHAGRLLRISVRHGASLPPSGWLAPAKRRVPEPHAGRILARLGAPRRRAAVPPPPRLPRRLPDTRSGSRRSRWGPQAPAPASPRGDVRDHLRRVRRTGRGALQACGRPRGLLSDLLSRPPTVDLIRRS